MVKRVIAECDKCGKLVHEWIWRPDSIMDNQDLCKFCYENKKRLE